MQLKRKIGLRMGNRSNKQNSRNNGEYSKPPKYSKPEEVGRFVQESGLDAVSGSIGSASGHCSEILNLDIER
jgi:hypothetical protein